MTLEATRQPRSHGGLRVCPASLHVEITWFYAHRICRTLASLGLLGYYRTSSCKIDSCCFKQLSVHRKSILFAKDVVSRLRNCPWLSKADASTSRFYELPCSWTSPEMRGFDSAKSVIIMQQTPSHQQEYVDKRAVCI